MLGSPAHYYEAGEGNLVKRLTVEADPAAYEPISSVNSLEEDIGLALYDDEAKTEREATKKVKGARFMLECLKKIPVLGPILENLFGNMGN